MENSAGMHEGEPRGLRRAVGGIVADLSLPVEGNVKEAARCLNADGTVTYGDVPRNTLTLPCESNAHKQSAAKIRAGSDR